MPEENKASAQDEKMAEKLMEELKAQGVDIDALEDGGGAPAAAEEPAKEESKKDGHGEEKPKEEGKEEKKEEPKEEKPAEEPKAEEKKEEPAKEESKEGGHGEDKPKEEEKKEEPKEDKKEESKEEKTDESKDSESPSTEAVAPAPAMEESISDGTVADLAKKIDKQLMQAESSDYFELRLPRILVFVIIPIVLLLGIVAFILTS